MQDSDNSSTEEPFQNSDSNPNYISESESLQESEPEQITVKKGRKRIKRQSKQTKNKKLKDLGQQYKRYRGKGTEVAPRTIGPPCTCKNKCFDKIQEEEREALFSSFWKLGKYDIQNAYLKGLMRRNHVKRKTKKTETKRTGTIEYCVQLKSSSPIVCKNAFISLHGITRGRVEYLVAKLKSGENTPNTDARGKHAMHKVKYSQEDTQAVRNFIDSLPRYQSHYSRHKNMDKEYLSMEYNIEMLYERYKENCQEKNASFVSSDKFRRIFVEDYNIYFKTPKSDTCAKCDEYEININNAKETGDDEKLKVLNNEKELHLRKAEKPRQLLRQAIEESKQDSNVHVITFDLEQALPTPKLTTGPCFYKKKLWCYNFSIHRCSEPEKGHFFLWNESVAKRGADEIASCLKKYFEEFDIRGKTLYAMSDNCCGQNKNWTVVGFWLQLLASGRFEKIIQIFPQVGHSMLASDRDFALVEKFARTKNAIYSPTEWEAVLRGAQKKRSFSVTTLTKEDFFNFSLLKESFTQSTFGIASCVIMEFNKSEPYILRAYDAYSGVPKVINLKKKKGRPSTSSLEENFCKELLQKYNDSLPIDPSKLSHVISCLQWIPPIHHPFYLSLKSGENN